MVIGMHRQPSITLRVMPTGVEPWPELLDLCVRPEQHAWIGVIADVLADLARCPQSDSMAIMLGDAAIGHCRIDPHARSIAGHDFALPTLGLRAFFIDARWQGKGLGTSALCVLLADLAVRYPAARQLALSVDTGNHVARHLYVRAGFDDSGELYHGRHSGAQQLLLRPLP